MRGKSRAERAGKVARRMRGESRAADAREHTLACLIYASHSWPRSMARSCQPVFQPAGSGIIGRFERDERSHCIETLALDSELASAHVRLGLFRAERAAADVAGGKSVCSCRQSVCSCQSLRCCESLRGVESSGGSEQGEAPRGNRALSSGSGRAHRARWRAVEGYQSEHKRVVVQHLSHE